MNEPLAKPPGPDKSTRKLIYVVDDEPMLLELAVAILRPLRYELQTFRDPETALNTFLSTQRRPDLLITDYAMHTLNGMDLIERCRRVQPAQKVLLVSGTIDEEIYAHSSIKPDCFLPKPYQARQLIETVQAMLAD